MQTSDLLLIDLSGIAHQMWHTSQSEPDPDTTSRRTVEKVRALASAHPHAAVCCDSGRSFRYDVDPSYKAQRPAQDAPLKHQILVAREQLVNDGFPVWSVAGFEADDLIASATARALQDDETTVLIASDDKDLLALVGDRVNVHRITSGIRMDAEAVKAKLGVEPSKVRDWLSLVGDKSDNVKGADGIGEKKAAALLNTFGSLDALYAEMAKGQAGLSPGMRTALVEFQPRLPVVRQLISLRADVPIPFEEIAAERTPKDVAPLEEYDDMSQHDEQPQWTPAEPAIRTVQTTDDPANRPAIEAVVQQLTANTPLPAPTAHGNGQALAVRQPQPDVLAAAPVEWEKQLEPRSMRDAQSLATAMHQAKLFQGYGSPPAVLSTIMAGRELGLQAIASLRAFHIVEGRHMLSADLIRALVLKSGLVDFFKCTERTAERATFITHRKDDPDPTPTTLTYTIAEGRTAFGFVDGMKESDRLAKETAWSKSGWGRNPADLCVARAGAKLARLVVPEVSFGLYSAEEFD